MGWSAGVFGGSTGRSRSPELAALLPNVGRAQTRLPASALPTEPAAGGIVSSGCPGALSAHSPPEGRAAPVCITARPARPPANSNTALPSTAAPSAGRIRDAARLCRPDGTAPGQQSPTHTAPPDSTAPGQQGLTWVPYSPTRQHRPRPTEPDPYSPTRQHRPRPTEPDLGPIQPRANRVWPGAHTDPGQQSLTWAPMQPWVMRQ